MEELNQTQQATSIQQPVVKNSNFLVSLLSILLLLAVLIAGFFAYQTQNLVKELSRLQPTPTPLVVASPTPDPTANWKTYSKEGLDLSFKYPEQLIIIEDGIDPKKTSSEVYMQLSPNKESNFKFLMFTFSILKSSQSISEYIKDIANHVPAPIYQDMPLSTQWIGSNKNVPTHYSSFSKDGYIYTIGLIDVSDVAYESENKVILDQILSTFEFLNSSSSPKPTLVACTMDAKICPDGSSVGRTGPKCEFAPCPTP